MADSKEYQSLFSDLESELRKGGLPVGWSISDLEDFINELETLAETANNLFDKIG